MICLAKKIGLDESVIKRLENLGEKENIRISLCAEKCAQGNFSCLKKEAYLIRLAVILQLAVRVKSRYTASGIGDDVYYDTMSDIKIWCENCGNRGIKNYGWLKNHVSFELFRLGRLQFQLFECKSKYLNYSRLPFSRGERVIYIHIPQGEKLSKDNCVRAIKLANTFFPRFFPDHSYKYYFCESWLLFEGNREFMAENSNILAFASLFEHCYSVKIDTQAIDRIFGGRRLLKRNYPESTSLQKRAKAYILGGGRLGAGISVINRNNFS